MMGFSGWLLGVGSRPSAVGSWPLAVAIGAFRFSQNYKISL